MEGSLMHQRIPRQVESGRGGHAGPGWSDDRALKLVSSLPGQRGWVFTLTRNQLSEDL